MVDVAVAREAAAAERRTPLVLIMAVGITPPATAEPISAAQAHRTEAAPTRIDAPMTVTASIRLPVQKARKSSCENDAFTLPLRTSRSEQSYRGIETFWKAARASG